MKDYDYNVLSIFIFLLTFGAGFALIAVLEQHGVLDNSYSTLLIINAIILLVLFIRKKQKKNNAKKGLWNNVVLNLLCFFFIILLPQGVFIKGFESVKPHLSEFAAVRGIDNLITDSDFNKEIKDLLKIKDEVSTDLLENYGVLYFLSKNKNLFQEKFISNEVINSKLNQYGVEVNDLFNYCDNYVRIHSNLYYIGYYVGALFFLIIIYYFHRRIFISENHEQTMIKIRRNIYIVAFIIYFVSFIDTSNEGFFSFIINKVNDDVILTKEAIGYMLKFANTFKEAFLTFIIFDTILDSLEKLNNLQVKKASVQNIVTEDFNSHSNKDKCQAHIMKRIEGIDSKYDAIKRNNIELEEKIKSQETKINELNRKIKMLTGNRN